MGIQNGTVGLENCLTVSYKHLPDYLVVLFPAFALKNEKYSPTETCMHMITEALSIITKN